MDILEVEHHIAPEPPKPKMSLYVLIVYAVFCIAFLAIPFFVSFEFYLRSSLPETAAWLDYLAVITGPLIAITPILGALLVLLALKNKIHSTKKFYIAMGILAVLFIIASELNDFRVRVNPYVPFGSVPDLFSTKYTPITDFNSWFIQQSILLMAFFIPFFGIILWIMIEAEKLNPNPQKQFSIKSIKKLLKWLLMSRDERERAIKEDAS